MSSSLKRNLLLTGITMLLIGVVSLIPDYHYIFRDLPNNSKFIFAHWNDSPEKKYKLRFGVTFTYLNYINQHSPPDAIILMPPDSILLDPKGKFKFKKEIVVKPWASYFVYPRILVYDRDKNTDSLYSKASYVAVVNGWGAGKARYKLKNKLVNGLVRINY